MRPTSLPAFGKILWAVDPFGTEIHLTTRAEECLRHLTEGSSAVIDAVYVRPIARLPVPTGELQSFNHLAEEDAQRRLDALVERTHGLTLRPPRVLRAERGSLRATVEQLLGFALRSGHELVVVSTHARSGARRWLLGSFAETCLSRSPFPVLVANPDCKIAPMTTLLFATDLSTVSHEALRQLLPRAHRLGAEIVAVHVLPPFFSPSAVPWLGAPPLSNDAILAEVERRREQWEHWKQDLESFKVPLRFEVLPPTGSVVETLAEYAASHPAGFLALASQSGPVETFFLGSAARQLCRISPIPVLVLHGAAVQRKLVASLERRLEEEAESAEAVDLAFPGF